MADLEVTPELLAQRGIPLLDVAERAGKIAATLDAGIAALGIMAGTGTVATAYHSQIGPAIKFGHELLLGLSQGVADNFDGVTVTGQGFSTTEAHNTTLVGPVHI
jgi:hypothetical protein